MKGFIVALAGFGLLAVSALAQVPDAGKAATAPAPATGDLKDLKQKVAYGIGVTIAKQLKAQALDIDTDILVRGLRDALADKATLSDQQIREAMIAYQQEMLGKVKKEGEDFLAANKKKPGVRTTASGLQYQVVKEGTGKTPKDTDTVSVHYEGKLIDGTVFDSSYKRGQPQDLQVNGVIKGWTEALKMMKVGSKWKLFIPSDLAYGASPRPGGPIRPHDTLIFDIELLGVK
jgi:FKBP-type peptidyl-prolyl cis-trans isomerase